MKQELLTMSNQELRKYLSTHRQDETAFSEALEVLMSRKKDAVKYPAISENNYQELQDIFKSKLNSN
ncbi:DUF6887 family protein [Cyanobacterium sp. DS4]|uniref:DUF6887 family protein n=1 Tax=Cyanobacterium sp. DS4 TaxID=2878255 RepID=UPI002E7FF888|nr:hypothetical protein [Cyanobacterium sp. Dongsha4]WVL00615.1 hypothetical protein Dongsha4_18555 [Cyanobacterium sp. Dongsha4]